MFVDLSQRLFGFKECLIPIVDANLTAIHGAAFWVIPLITVLRVGNRIVDTESSVAHLDVGIRTSWTSDHFRTLEFAALSLSLPFESVCPTTTVDSTLIDDIVVIDREPLAMVADLLREPSHLLADPTSLVEQVAKLESMVINSRERRSDRLEVVAAGE